MIFDKTDPARIQLRKYVDIDEIDDAEVKSFANWYADMFHVQDGEPTPLTWFTNSLCGAFHLCDKQGKQVIKRAKKLGIVKTVRIEGETFVEIQN